jgi:hypothetical protein
VAGQAGPAQAKVRPRSGRSPCEDPRVSYSIASIYFFIKFLYFFSLVRIQVKFDPMKDRPLFLGFLYTAGVAFLSFVFLVSWQPLNWAPWQNRVAQAVGVSPWLAWVGETFLLSTAYFWLMAKFDEGVIFWTLLLLGVLVVLF